MQRKILTLILFLITLLFSSANVFAFYWGVFESYEKNYSRFALYKILNNIAITYAIDFNSDEQTAQNIDKTGTKEDALRKELNTNLNQEKKQAELQGLIKYAFNAWLKDTKNMIIKDGREEEFADIMPILSKQVILKKINDKDAANIVFYFTTEEEILKTCGEDHPACISVSDDNSAVSLGLSYLNDPKKQKELLPILIHELGHYFALVDQYDDFGDSSLKYGTSDRLYKYDSVMSASYENALGCDDVDGFINILDLTLSLENGKFSNRAQKSWASFCNGKKDGDGNLFKDAFYKEARQLNRPDYIRNGNIYAYNNEGYLKGITHAPLFNLYDADVVKDPEEGVILSAKTDQFEYQYYNWLTKEKKIDVYIDDKKNDNLAAYSIQRTKNATWTSYSDDGRIFTIKFDSKDNCTISESFNDITAADHFGAIFDANNKLKVYEHMRKMPKEKGSLDHLDFIITPDDSCKVYYEDTKILFFNMTEERENTVSYKNEQELNNHAAQVGLTPEQLIDKMENLCYDTFINSRIYQETCQYFREIEDKLEE